MQLTLFLLFGNTMIDGLIVGSAMPPAHQCLGLNNHQFAAEKKEISEPAKL